MAIPSLHWVNGWISFQSLTSREEAMMHRIGLTVVVLSLLGGGILKPVSPDVAMADEPLLIAQQAATYKHLMTAGYRATAQRQYKTALQYFQQALQRRPRDTYATQAIRNVSYYLQRSHRIPIGVTPSGIGAPSERRDAGTRTEECASEAPLTAVVPEKTVGLTASAHPTLFFYVPKTIAQYMQLVVFEEGKVEQVYRAQIPTPPTASLIRVDLAQLNQIPALGTGKTYRWGLTLVCNEDDFAVNPTVAGYIKRMQLDPLLVQLLEKTNGNEKRALLAANGLWFDAIAALHAEPPETRKEEWTTLLESEQLQSLISQPFTEMTAMEN